MNLKRKKSFEVGILLISVCEVSTFFTIQVGFNMVTFALNYDGIPGLPFEEAITLLSERVFYFSRSLFVGVQPSTTGFIVNTSSPSACPILKIVVLALVSGDSAIRISTLLKGPEHTA